MKKAIFGDKGGATKRGVELMARRNKLSDYLPWIQYIDEHQMFLNLDDTVGWIWEIQPLTFCGMKQVKGFESLLKQSFPKGTVMQWILYPDHDISPTLDAYLADKTRDDKLAQISSFQYAEQLRKGVSGMSKAHGIPTRNFRSFMCLKSPNDLDMDDIAVIEETMQGIGLAPRRWTPADLMEWSRQFFNGFDTKKDRSYTTGKPLRKQIIDPDSTFDFSDEPAQLGHRFGRCITPKVLGSEIDPLKTNTMFGGIMGMQDDTQQITSPFLYSLNILFDNAEQGISHKMNIMSSMRVAGGLAKALGRRLDELNWALDTLADGDRFLNIVPTMWVFGDTPEEVASSSARVERIWKQSSDITPQTEKHINQALFISSLPFGFYNLPGNLEIMDRHFVQSAKATARMIPCQGDFKGSANPRLLYTGRKGQLAGLDLFDPRANAHNFLVSAETGAGKSFSLNNLVQNYYNAGAKIRLADIGGSFKKGALINRGRYMEFGKEHICINPYDFAYGDDQDYQQGIAAAVNVVAEMAYSASGGTMKETEWSLIKQASRWVMEMEYQVEGMDAIHRFLSKYPDGIDEEIPITKDIIEDAHRLAFNLTDFTSKGAYGRFFCGKSTFDISSDEYVVVELESLRSNPELFGVVVMQVMNNITQDLYLGDRSTQTFILFEETASLLNQVGNKDLSRLGNMIEEGYRRARKYTGAFGVVLQSLLDLHQFGKVGQVIKANATFKFLLQGNTYPKAIDDKLINFSGLDADLLESVKNNPPQYSEMMIDSPIGRGVVRFFADPWTYWLNTSKGTEVQMFETLLEQGNSPYQAMQKLTGIR